MIDLAVVIPAYKFQFLDKALGSIASQTCKEFNVYIGDDASPQNLKEIADKYSNKLNIKYTRFKDNIGSVNLVAHWERCIDMTNEEKWVWLFSDDDLMDADCVENFFKTQWTYSNFDIYHFNVVSIDESDKKITSFFEFPDVTFSEEFIQRKLRYPGNYSTVIEYIFRKESLRDVGGFQYFDLAWGSDDATWIKLSRKNGIRNISNSKVYWRKSRFNISPKTDKKILSRKYNAQVKYAVWLCTFIETHKLKLDLQSIQSNLKSKLLTGLKSEAGLLPCGTIKKIIKDYNKSFTNTKINLDEFYSICSWKLLRTLSRTFNHG